MLKLLIVVPVLNESETLLKQRHQLEVLRMQGAQIVLVDGGSTDHTVRVAREAGLHVIESAKGRAVQMNAGARVVNSDNVLFLHIDTTLPTDAPHLIEQHLSSVRCWGRFDVCIVGQSAWLGVIGRCMNLRSRLSGIATGDQAIFMTREAFEVVGGFPDQPLMEDIEMSKRLKQLSPPICLTQQVMTSGRRWDVYGVWQTILLMWRLRWAYWRGTSADDLAQRYR